MSIGKPFVQRPTYLGLAPNAELPPAVKKVADTVAPIGGLALGAVVGAVAAYFVPKLLDHYLSPPESENVDFEVEG